MELIFTGFVFGVGFVCGVVSGLVLGGKALEFLRVGFVRVRFVSSKQQKNDAANRSGVSLPQDESSDGKGTVSDELFA